MDRSEQLTRKALKTIPQGTYRYADCLDNDGIELDKPVRIEVAATIEGGTAHCDFESTGPQTKGPFNAVPSGSQAAAYFAVRSLTDPSIPTNGGCFRPVTLRLPEGTLVNPEESAPVNSRTATIKRIASCIVGALKEAPPARVPADASSSSLVLMFGGKQDDGYAFRGRRVQCRRQRRWPTARWRRCHRDKRQQLHEPAGGGPGVGGTGTGPPHGPARRFGRPRPVPRRPGLRAGVRVLNR